MPIRMFVALLAAGLLQAPALHAEQTFVPLGIAPAAMGTAPAPGSLAAIRFDTTIPVGSAQFFPGGMIPLAIESELAPGILAPQTPDDLPRAHLRARAPDGTPDPRAVTVVLRSSVPAEVLAANRHQAGANRHQSPWIVAIADPRASIDYPCPDSSSKASCGCDSCDRPAHLAGDDEVLEIRPAGSWIRVRVDLTPEELESAPPEVRHLAERLAARVRVIAADLTRPSIDPLAAANPPTDGFRMEQLAMLHTREIAFSATDLAVRARNTVVALTRVYSSAVAHFGPFGRNFDSPWFARIRELPDGNVELYDGTGRRDLFTRFGETYQAPPGVFLDLRRHPAGGFVLLGRTGAKMIFDRHGRLERILDSNATKSDGSDGNAVAFLRDPGGRLITIVDPIGRAFAIDYYDQSGGGAYAGLIASVTDFSGRRIDYRYDGSGRLVEVSGPDPQSDSSETPRTRYEWAAPLGAFPARVYRTGQIVRERDGEDRIAWEVVYDEAQPWAANAILSGGGTWTLSATGALRQVLDPLGIATSFQHDASGRVTAISDGAGATRKYEFDAEGRLIASVEPLGERTEIAYDDAAAERRHRANLTSTTQRPRPGTAEELAGVARSTAWSYDAAGRVDEVVYPDGSAQSIARDARGNPKAITDAAGITTAYEFDERGLLRSVDDPRSGKTEFVYEANDPKRAGFLRAVSTAAGTTEYEADERGNVGKITDPTGRTATFAHNALDQLEREKVDDSESRLRYDATGALTERRALAAVDAAGEPVWQTTTSAIDVLGRITSSTDAGITTTWAYDAAGNTKTVSAPGSPVTSYAYDTLGRIGALSIGGKTTTYQYDANGQSAAVTDALGRTTTFLLDGFGASVGTVDALGISTVDRQDAAGRPVDSRVVKTLPDGSKLLLRWTVREFDAAGRLVREIRKLFDEPIMIPPDGSDPAGAKDVIFTTVYDDAGRKVTHIDPLGRATVSEMDALGRLARTIDPAGNELRIEYDAAGNRSAEVFLEAGAEEATPWPSFLRSASVGGRSEAIPSRILYQYDAHNRVIGIHDVSDPERTLSTQYEYDRRGNLVRAIDPENRESAFEYDLRGRRRKIVDAEGAETRLQWDDADRLVALIDANGNRTEWIWDGEGRLAAEVRADGAQWVYGYDVQGNRTSMVDPNGSVTHYHRDGLDRLIGLTVDRADGVVGPSSITYVLDDLGRVVATETDEGVRTTAKFDSLDRALREAIRIGEGAERAVDRSFDHAGQPVALRYPSGLQIFRSFDALGRIAEIRDAGTALLARWRDVGLRQVERESGNGVVDRWEWDANRRLRSIESGAPCGIAAGCDPLRRIEYVRAPAGAKVEVIRPDLELRRRYRLDRLDRVVEERREHWPDGMLASRVLYELDPLLNPRVVERDEPAALSAPERRDTEVNERNQLTSFGGERLSWDANGNLRARDGLILGYDATDRLARAALADGTEIEVLRDAFGRKVRETLSFGGSSRVTVYTYDGARAIEEWTGGALAARYVHGRGIDEILRAERSTALDGTLDETLWPLQDELGTVDALTSPTGQILTRFDYAPWGDPLPSTSALPTPWPHLFQGRQWNPHLRAYDYRARTLFPDLARFAQEDPAGMADHPNLYQPLLGNWTGATDPTGRVVVMQHGIRDDGRVWAQEVSDRLTRRWASDRADAGQDVVMLVQNTYNVFRWFGLCDYGTFCFQNAARAARVFPGFLDRETRNAGARIADTLSVLQGELISSRDHKREPLQMIAHSHGTAMLLSATYLNQQHRKFKLKTIVLIGSDLTPYADLEPFLSSTDRLISFYSSSDATVRSVAGAGFRGFRVEDPFVCDGYDPSRDCDPWGFFPRPNTERFQQHHVANIAHSASQQERRAGVISWVSGLMASEYYAAPLAIFERRRGREDVDWRTRYEVFREVLAPTTQTELPDDWDKPYPAQ